MPILAILMNLLNLKKLIPFIIANWKVILILGMAFIIWYQNFNDTRFLFGAETIPSLEMQLEAAVVAVDICKAGNDVLSEAIDERNAEVQKWKGISTGLEQDIANLENVLGKMRNQTKTEVEIILKGDTPKTCEASIDYLRDGRKDLKW